MRDLDRVINRKGTNSVKWDALNIFFGKDDLIPLWVADMDFPAPDEVTEALIERAKHPVYGYSILDDRYYHSIINWFSKKHKWNIEKDWIVYTPGVVPAINWLIQSLTEAGDKIIIQEPVYHPFKESIKLNDRIPVINELRLQDDNYLMDFESLEACIDDKVKLLILCNPHNPVGRVWTKEELENLGRICLKHNILVISDEIHGDLTYKGHNHIPYSSISEEFANNSVVCTAPTKTFNLAGLQCPNIIIPNETLRDKFNDIINKQHIQTATPFGIVGVQAAYENGENWLQEVMEYIEGNLEYMINFFKENIPEIKVIKPQGTYLAWLDFTALNIPRKELNHILIDKAKVALNDGYMFGKSGENFQRINIACPRLILEEGLKRMEKQFRM
ncbi:cystathione beta-lyase [Clostridium amylolyticum]|uniref:cysteine-S-conjugate beta-lyase n=1 Tax=Clostridium amylolyticum TaxID=1121298 RepID=A0A1M6LDZ4_9CLOT|nr:MalY/PatB family protein [Clostridium amylolyticum]SHJ69362.1 cystathione beta-lyase [Clostridium amylolyticum]